MSRVNGGVHERQRVPFTRLIWGWPTASSGPGVKNYTVCMHFQSIDEHPGSKRRCIVTGNKT